MFALCPQTINRYVRICFSRAATRSRNQTQKLIRLTKTQHVFLHTEIRAQQFTTAITMPVPTDYGKKVPSQFWRYYSYKTNAENVTNINSITD